MFGTTASTKPSPAIALYDSTNALLASKDITICKDATLKVTAEVTNANGASVTYDWGKENDLSFTQASATLQTTVSDAYNYIVTAVMNGCESKDTIHTGYYPTPVVTVDGSKNTCPNGDANLSVSITGGSGNASK